MSVLVCGGAGYIGSHTVKELIGKYKVIILDNFSTGFPFLVDSNTTFINGNLGDEEVLNYIFKTYNIDVVFHFAANSLVGESIHKPLQYYENNVSSTLTLLSKMLENGVKKFIFSSTAATYGIPNEKLITENTQNKPINPYGRSKLFIEEILPDLAKAYGLEYVILRYFNAAGAHESGLIGESHDPETHLIPLVIQHLLGKREKIQIYGIDYDTPDGTCVRDYVHVTDLATAHILAYEGLVKGIISNEIYNLGNGTGYSVKEIIEKCEMVAGKKAIIEYGERRLGDPEILVASAEKIYQDLGWKAKHSLESIVESAWKWHTLNN